MSKIRAIIWDIGGVLLTDSHYGDFWQDKEQGKKLRKLFGSGKISKKEFVERGARLLEKTKKEFLKEYLVAHEVNPNLEVVRIYFTLNLPAYIFSDTNPYHLEYVQKEYKKILNHAKKRFYSHKIKARKEEDKSYRLVLKEIKFDPEEILYIDNKQKHLERASKFGIKTLLFKSPNKLKKDLKKLRLK